MTRVTQNAQHGRRAGKWHSAPRKQEALPPRQTAARGRGEGPVGERLGGLRATRGPRRGPPTTLPSGTGAGPGRRTAPRAPGTGPACGRGAPRDRKRSPFTWRPPTWRPPKSPGLPTSASTPVTVVRRNPGRESPSAARWRGGRVRPPRGAPGTRACRPAGPVTLPTRPRPGHPPPAALEPVRGPRYLPRASRAPGSLFLSCSCLSILDLRRSIFPRRSEMTSVYWAMW